MSLREQIFDDFKTAMKQQQKQRLSTLKMLKSSIQNQEIEKGDELDDDEVRALLSKEAKSRRESIEQYEKGGREDLVEKERKELELIQDYLPDPLSEQELEELIEDVIERTGARDMSDMGAVMGEVMPEVRGRADGDRVNRMVREKLS